MSRRRAVVTGLVAAIALIAATAFAWNSAVPGWERALFEAVNRPDVVPFAAVWPLMQLGNVLVVPLAAAAAVVKRRFRLAATVLVVGIGAYLLAKVLKAVVGRPRPAELLDGVVIRGPTVSDDGFVSGHAAVATAVAIVLIPQLGRRARALLVAVAVLVAVARVYVGAHLPLDVVGGAALAVAVAAVVDTVTGRRRAAGSALTGSSSTPAPSRVRGSRQIR